MLKFVDDEKLGVYRVGEPSECLRTSVQSAREIQRARFSCLQSFDIACDADMRMGEIRQFRNLPEDGQNLICAAACIAMKVIEAVYL